MRPNNSPRQPHKRRAFDNLVFGRQPVYELLNSDKEVDTVYVQAGAQGDVVAEIRKLASLREIPVKTVPPEKLNKLTGGNHQGVIAFTAQITYSKIEDVLPFVIEQGEAPLLLLLDGITDVGNFGAICRTAWAAGVHAVIIPAAQSAPVNADAIKASAGALHQLPVCRSTDLLTTLEYLRLNGLQIYGADAQGALLPDQTDFSVPCVLVMGSEDNGIRPEVARLLQGKVAAPMLRAFNSYNVSVATGMLLYECMRQRRSRK